MIERQTKIYIFVAMYVNCIHIIFYTRGSIIITIKFTMQVYNIYNHGVLSNNITASYITQFIAIFAYKR